MKTYLNIKLFNYILVKMYFVFYFILYTMSIDIRSFIFRGPSVFVKFSIRS